MHNLNEIYLKARNNLRVAMDPLLLRDKEAVQLHLLDLQYLIVKQLLYMKLKESLLLTNHFSLMVYETEELLSLPLLMALVM